EPVQGHSRPGGPGHGRDQEPPGSGHDPVVGGEQHVERGPAAVTVRDRDRDGGEALQSPQPALPPAHLGYRQPGGPFRPGYAGYLKDHRIAAGTILGAVAYGRERRHRLRRQRQAAVDPDPQIAWSGRYRAFRGHHWISAVSIVAPGPM